MVLIKARYIFPLVSVILLSTQPVFGNDLKAIYNDGKYTLKNLPEENSSKVTGNHATEGYNQGEKDSSFENFDTPPIIIESDVEGLDDSICSRLSGYMDEYEHDLSEYRNDMRAEIESERYKQSQKDKGEPSREFEEFAQDVAKIVDDFQKNIENCFKNDDQGFIPERIRANNFRVLSENMGFIYDNKKNTYSVGDVNPARVYKALSEYNFPKNYVSETDF
ncbi:hypothetical protein AYI68_g836 [Smittium mucronatum]|uniref:Uncharacterized protein n=1 Tax=Smittium mucronatum TaxID=133383 RepID=A0A1R0H728_9FUNG|nr:hypothetical protein AYI68_g836 [Smittium mucronatum]